MTPNLNLRARPVEDRVIAVRVPKDENSHHLCSLLLTGDRLLWLRQYIQPLEEFYETFEDPDLPTERYSIPFAQINEIRLDEAQYAFYLKHFVNGHLEVLYFSFEHLADFEPVVAYLQRQAGLIKVRERKNPFEAAMPGIAASIVVVLFSIIFVFSATGKRELIVMLCSVTVLSLIGGATWRTYKSPPVETFLITSAFARYQESQARYNPPVSNKDERYKKPPLPVRRGEHRPGKKAGNYRKK